MCNPFVLSKVEISRNLSDYFFVNKLEVEEARSIAKKIEKAVKEMEVDGYFHSLSSMGGVEQKLWQEKGIIDNAMEKNWRISSVLHNQGLTLKINGKDHLTIETLEEGLKIRQAFEKAYEIEDQMDHKLDFAFDPKYGYLQTNPSRAGTGLKLSCFLHLKAFRIKKVLKKFRDSMLRLGYHMEPLWGDDRLDIYEISYEKGYLETEEESLEKFEATIDRIFKNERDLRRDEYKNYPEKSKDRYFRALGIIRYGRIINEGEIFEAISNLLYGYSLGFHDLKESEILALIPICQKYHLLEYKNKLHSSRPIEYLRGDRIRTHLKEVNNGD